MRQRKAAREDELHTTAAEEEHASSLGVMRHQYELSRKIAFQLQKRGHDLDGVHVKQREQREASKPLAVLAAGYPRPERLRQVAKESLAHAVRMAEPNVLEIGEDTIGHHLGQLRLLHRLLNGLHLPRVMLPTLPQLRS